MGWDHGTSLSGENIRLIMMLYPEPKTVGLIYFRNTRRCRRLRGHLTNHYLEPSRQIGQVVRIPTPRHSMVAVYCSYRVKNGSILLNTERQILH